MPMIGNMPAWWEILRRCGYPTKVVVLDWETYFDEKYHMGLAGDSLSTIEFLMDTRYEEMGVAAIHMPQPFVPITTTFWRGGRDAETYIQMLQNSYGQHLEGVTVVAQNLNFDGTILARKYGINPVYAIDLLGLARHEESRDHNDLGSMAERYNLPPKGETLNFKGVHLNAVYDRQPGKLPKLITPGITEEKFGQLAEYACRDAWLEWHLFTHMLPRLSRPEVELRVMQHTTEMFLKPTMMVDQDFAVELIGKMTLRIDEVVAATGNTKEDISGTNSFGRLLGQALESCGDSLAPYQKDGKPKKDGTPVKLLAIAKDDPGLELLTLHRDPRVKCLMAARTAIKSWPLHIQRVQRIANQAKAAGGALPMPLKYCGAHTGRWAGGEKINVQNLPSRSLEALVNAMRQLFIAPPEHKLVVVDASQIEARVCDWIAGEIEWLEIWKDHSRDPYCEFASKISSRRLWKPKKTDPKPVIKYLTRMRGMGKVGVLGCGYGMGKEKARVYAENSYGVTMTEVEAEDLVKTYRSTHPHVCKFWRMIEQKFKAAARYKEPGTLNGLKFHYEDRGDITVITLPNGRTLKYPHVRVSIINGREQMWMPNPMKPGDRTFMWGGFLTENIVQAMSRDILAEAVLKSEEAGYHVALHVHDEEVAVVIEEKCEKALAEIIKIMSTPPEWCASCPLSAEGKISVRYEK